MCSRFSSNETFIIRARALCEGPAFGESVISIFVVLHVHQNPISETNKTFPKLLYVANNIFPKQMLQVILIFHILIIFTQKIGTVLVVCG